MKRIQNKENKADPQPCIQNVPECFLEAPANLKPFDVLTSLGNKKFLPPYKFYSKPIFNYTYQNNNKTPAVSFKLFESWRPSMQISTQHLNLQVTTANYNWGHF